MENVIPLSHVPSQVLSVQLNNRSCKLSIYQKRTGLFIDISVNGAAVVTGALCRDRVWIVRSAYLGFPGDLSFIDQQGTHNPEYTGLSTRYKLVWRQ